MAPDLEPARADQAPAGHGQPLPRLAGSEPGKPDERARQAVRGSFPATVPGDPSESPELRAMRELDQELFPPAAGAGEPPWATSPVLPAPPGPRVDISGLPASGLPGPAPSEPQVKDLGWLTTLAPPAIPARWEGPVVRYLEYYRDTPRGRALVRRWVQKSGRYGDAIRAVLREHGLPEDLVWVALVESGFEPTARSHAGAVGLWQFMPATGRIYGLTVNRRVDERLDPARSTQAAARHLKDLFGRFGSWELAFAAYNMGYGGLLATVRKYNTNDFWELARLEAALPYETALYVPKIVAMAVVAHNCKLFGCEDVELERPKPFDRVAVGPGTTLEAIAVAVDEPYNAIASLNPHVVGSRFPPLETAGAPRRTWTAYVPKGKGKLAAEGVHILAEIRSPVATHTVRWGETLDRVARQFGVQRWKLERLNDLYPSESPRPGTVLFVPAAAARPATASGGGAGSAAAGKGEREEEDLPVVVVPQASFAYAGRRRVFYEVVPGDSVPEVAGACGPGVDELRRWNKLAPDAALQDGMWLQLFLPEGHHPAGVVLAEEPEVSVLPALSPAFFAYFEGRKGRRRLEIEVQAGDTWSKLGERYGLPLAELERINQRSRKSLLQPGETVVVYAKNAGVPGAPGQQAKPPEPGAPAPAPGEPPAGAPAGSAPAAPEGVGTSGAAVPSAPAGR
ncbi:MAG: transglycosylase SLT domain-containing protein [Deltaproteobacteria bacterium]|nr:transglycosylase SLT domain-containing protein [Deltaproteobacteria bacterium]